MIITDLSTVGEESAAGLIVFGGACTGIAEEDILADVYSDGGIIATDGIAGMGNEDEDEDDIGTP